MKRMLPLFLAALLTLSACSRKAAEAPESVIPTFPSPTTESSALPTPAIEETAPAAGDAGASVGDFIDLTVLSSTMVFAEVFNMTTHPEDYVGKTVKMQGLFSTGRLYAQEGTFEDGSMVFACIIQDAAACCAQGIPFDLAESLPYPEDYPELGTPITVIGTFELCTQDGLEFCRLSQAELLDAEI